MLLVGRTCLFGFTIMTSGAANEAVNEIVSNVNQRSMHFIVNDLLIIKISIVHRRK